MLVQVDPGLPGYAKLAKELDITLYAAVGLVALLRHYSQRGGKVNHLTEKWLAGLVKCLQWKGDPTVLCAALTASNFLAYKNGKWITQPEGQSKVEQAKEDAGFHAFARWWNGLAKQQLVPCGVSETRPSEAVLRAWSLASEDEELGPLVADVATLEKRIRASELCRGGWFRPEKLLRGKNKDGEYIIEKLVQGAYESKGRSHATTRAERLNADQLFADEA